MNENHTTTGLPFDATAYPTNRLMDLCGQVAVILGQHFDHQFDAVVTAGGRVWLKDAKRIMPAPEPEQAFEIAAAAMKVAAMNLDPTITRLWIGRDIGPGVGKAGRLSCITFERKGASK